MIRSNYGPELIIYLQLSKLSVKSEDVPSPKNVAVDAALSL
jgi:hypothetical protein